MKEICIDRTRAYITADGKLHYQGLFDVDFRVVGDQNTSIENLSVLDAPNRLEGYQENDVITDLQFGKHGNQKYVIVTIERNGNKVLYSKHFGQSVLCGSGR